MRARFLGSLAFAGAAAVGAACNGGGPTDALPGSGRMSAMIGDTLPWKANLTLKATLVDSVFELEGLERSGKFAKLSVRAVAIDTVNTTAVRQFVFSFTDAVTAGYALFSESSDDVFTTDVSGGSGRVTFTLLTDERAVGTFMFIASRPSGFDPIRRLASGVFDVRLQ